MRLQEETGQALAETAISSLIFLLVLMGVMECGHVFSLQLTLQNAVRQAGRYAITGNCIQGSNGACSTSRYNSVMQVLEDTSTGLLNPSNVSADVSMTCTNNGGGCPNNAGGPLDTVSISVSYPYHFVTPLMGPLFPGGTYTIKVSAAFVNEPFSPTQS